MHFGVSPPRSQRRSGPGQWIRPSLAFPKGTLCETHRLPATSRTTPYPNTSLRSRLIKRANDSNSLDPVWSDSLSRAVCTPSKSAASGSSALHHWTASSTARWRSDQTPNASGVPERVPDLPGTLTRGVRSAETKYRDQRHHRARRSRRRRQHRRWSPPRACVERTCDQKESRFPSTSERFAPTKVTTRNWNRPCVSINSVVTSPPINVKRSSRSYGSGVGAPDELPMSSTWANPPSAATFQLSQMGQLKPSQDSMAGYDPPIDRRPSPRSRQRKRNEPGPP